MSQFLFDLLNNQNHHTIILSRGDHLINLKHIYKKKHGKTIINDLNWHIEAEIIGFFMG